MKLVRQILCALGWHCLEEISDGPFGKCRCVCCGLEDYSEDYIVFWRHK